MPFPVQFIVLPGSHICLITVTEISCRWSPHPVTFSKKRILHSGKLCFLTCYLTSISLKRKVCNSKLVVLLRWGIKLFVKIILNIILINKASRICRLFLKYSQVYIYIKRFFFSTFAIDFLVGLFMYATSFCDTTWGENHLTIFWSLIKNMELFCFISFKIKQRGEKIYYVNCFCASIWTFKERELLKNQLRKGTLFLAPSRGPGGGTFVNPRASLMLNGWRVIIWCYHGKTVKQVLKFKDQSPL